MQDMVFCFSHKSSALSCDRAGVILKVIIVLLYHSIKKKFSDRNWIIELCANTKMIQEWLRNEVFEFFSKLVPFPFARN